MGATKWNGRPVNKSKPLKDRLEGLAKLMPTIREALDYIKELEKTVEALRVRCSRNKDDWC